MLNTKKNTGKRAFKDAERSTDELGEDAYDGSTSRRELEGQQSARNVDGLLSLNINDLEASISVPEGTGTRNRLIKTENVSRMNSIDAMVVVDCTTSYLPSGKAQ